LIRTPKKKKMAWQYERIDHTYSTRALAEIIILDPWIRGPLEKWPKIRQSRPIWNIIEFS